MNYYKIKLKYYSRYLWRELLLRSGWKNILYKNQIGNRILVFHGIDECGNKKFNSRFISQSFFEQLIRYCKQNFNIISLTDYSLSKFQIDKLNIAITFDDGYLNNYDLAVPVLNKYNVPATFFVCGPHEQNTALWPDFLDLVTFHTLKREFYLEGRKFKRKKKGFYHNSLSLREFCLQCSYETNLEMRNIFQEEWNIILSNSDLDLYWKLMTSENICALNKNPLFTIGGHGKSHLDLEKYNSSIIEQEVKQNKEYLEETGIKIKDFAFPFGSYGEELLEILDEEGYSNLFSADNELKKIDEYMLYPRFTINPWLSMEHLVPCIIKGSYL
jgi:peptidoglycan/xylan/chitin deacetylase (PgdA/CDA1 family)